MFHVAAINQGPRPLLIDKWGPVKWEGVRERVLGNLPVN